MTEYLLRVFLLLPLVAGMAFGALWLWKRVQPGMATSRRERLVRVVDAVPLGTTGRLAVVEFGGRHILIAVARGRIDKLAEAPADPSADAGFIDDGGALATDPAPAGGFDRFVGRP